MSDSCKGVFIDICPYYWVQNCNVTFEMLSEKFKTKSKTIQKLIKKEVIQHQNGIISISFLNEQMSELNKNKKYFSDMGKLGQEVKKSKAPLKPPLNDGVSYKDKDKDKDKDNITSIINLFNTITKKDFKTSSKKTRELIQARLKEGYSLNEFERVIKHKNQQWAYDESMKPYIRPETIFSNKFESYLQESPKAKILPKKATVQVPEEKIESMTPKEKEEFHKKWANIKNG